MASEQMKSKQSGLCPVVRHARVRLTSRNRRRGRARHTVRVARAGELGGRKVYGVQLESAGLPPLRVSLERVEVGVELAPDTFTLQPSTAPGQAK